MTEKSEPLHIKGAGYLILPEDITAFEAARLAEFLANLATLRPSLLNPRLQNEEISRQVKAHGLERLFKQELT